MKFLKPVVCLLSFVCSIRADVNFDCFHMLRGDATLINMLLPSIGSNRFAAARHHILRYERIQTFFNRAFHFNNNVRRELIEMSLLLLENAHQYYNADYRLAIRIAWEHLDTNFELPLQEAPFEWIMPEQYNDAIAILRAIWTWMPFNYVIGPRYRSDDFPEAIFDLATMHIIGEATYIRLEALNTAINSFVNAPPSATDVVCLLHFLYFENFFF